MSLAREQSRARRRSSRSSRRLWRIETGLRDAKRHKLVTRVADIEEKVFGAARD
jgi:hypothetical protein